MPKSDTIDAIVTLNPTAKPEFLAEFPGEDLCRYLDRLECVSVWPHTDDSAETAPPTRGNLSAFAM